MKLKLLQLLSDLLMNDDSVIENGFFIRDIVSKDTKLVDILIKSMADADIAEQNSSQNRSYTLDCLFRIYQREPCLKDKIENLV